MLSSVSCSSSDLSFFSPDKTARSDASSGSAVFVTTCVARKTLKSSRDSPLTQLPSPPPASHSMKKRKPLPIESSPPASPLPQIKRLRGSEPKRKSTSSKTSSRASSRRPPSPEPIYRRRSASISSANDAQPPFFCRRWVAEGVPQDESTFADQLSSESVVKGLMKSYKAYFNNPDDPNDRRFDPDPSSYPVVELEYPFQGASERFILLAPKDKDHYNPIMDLEQTLYTIVECYLTKDEQMLFGSAPSPSLSDTVSPPPSPSPSPSPPCSTASCSSTSTLTPVPSSSSPSVSPPPTPLPVLRAVQRAIHMQHGPLFLTAMERVNKLLHSIKYPEVPDDAFLPLIPNPMMAKVESWTGHHLPEMVLMRIIDENYQRTVGPNIPSLKCYEAFSSTVYGELMPPFVQEIVRTTGLTQDSLFLDLGSGVGNVVVQASLQSGCTSYGIELMPHPARVAKDVVEQIKIRCRMWGIRIGDMELEEGDMLESRRVDELIPKADVVLVDNKVFEESLNEALRPKFLDLKEGAYVVSLKPFVSSVNARVNKRNVDDISAIFRVEERVYHPGGVSWGSNGGTYYLHKVDRRGYAEIKKQFDSSHSSTGRTRTRK